MKFRKITALIVSTAMLLTSMPAVTYASDDINMVERDTAQNIVNKYAENGTLVGIDMEVQGVNDQGNDSYAYDATKNPYIADNGPIKVVIENADYAVVDVSYNGRGLETIGGQKQLLLHVNAEDRIIVKTTDKHGSSNYDGWHVEYGNKDRYYDEDTIALDLSSDFMGVYDKVVLKPWSGSGSTSEEYDDDVVSYRLLDDYNGAFGIDKYSGVVFVKDNEDLKNTTSTSGSVSLTNPIGFNFRYIGNTKNSKGVIKLTEEKQSQRSGAFLNDKISLESDFDISYNAYYGKETKNRSGADGMVFVLTATNPSYVGWSGGSLGYYGSNYFPNSIGIEFDTHKNNEWYGSDPYFGKNSENHIAFHSNGSVDHDNVLSYKNAQGNTANAHSVLLEDNKWHDVRITWDASEQELTVYFDNAKVGTLEKNIVAEYLNNNTEVYVGFTASTGSYSNKQRISDFAIEVGSSPSIVVEALYDGESVVMTVPFEITTNHETLNASKSTATLNEDQVKIIYASDHKGRVYKIDPEVQITEKIADTGIAWFDIANDKFTTLYGVRGDGRLYSDIDDSATYETDLSNPNLTINSLAVDESGNFYYVRNAVLKFYNDETGNITDIMNTTYQSLGDLVFHDDKLYYAAYKGSSYGSQAVLVELDIEEKTVREVASIPSQTYGMASVNGELLILFNKQIDKIDPSNGSRINKMVIGAGANYIYGSAQGEVMINDNVLLNDLGDSTKFISQVDGQDVDADQDGYMRVYGDYGVLLIKPDGTYIYILNGKLDVLLDLDQGETLTETFRYTSSYEDLSQSDQADLVITINGSDDAESDYNSKKGLHLNAFDIDGDNVDDVDVTDGESIAVWHDSAGYDNSAIAQSGNPTLALDGINGKRAVNFGSYTGGMNIASHEDINKSEFSKKSIAVVFETSNDISGVQYIFEEGGNVRGYNFVVAPDETNTPSLYAMVYNEVEWSSNQHRAIKLTTVEPNTVYAAYMVHNANSRTFKAYVNGDFIELQTSDIETNVDQQYAHPNPAGVGWINDDTIYPHNFVVDENGGAPFDGMIGEVISWNDALTFKEVQEVNGLLKRKWKQPEAVAEVSAKQIDNELQINWAPASGVSNYEVYLSQDGLIDSSDSSFTVSNNMLTVELPSKFKNLDNIQVIVRYVQDGGFSKNAQIDHKVLGQPQNFVYTDLGEENLLRYTHEVGKSYSIKHSGNVEVALGSSGYKLISSSIDISTVELYEVANSGGVPSLQAGHGIKADGPVEKPLKKVENLLGTLSGSNIELTWDNFSGAIQYIVYAGDDEATLTEITRTTSPNYTFNADASIEANQVGFKYFKVKAVTNNEYKFSADSDAVSVGTPYLAQVKAELVELIAQANALHTNAKEGLGNDELIENDLYDPGEYELGSKAIFKAIIETVEAVANASDTDVEITAALKTLNLAVAEFDTRKVLVDNSITLEFKDATGDAIQNTKTYYGPMGGGITNYQLTLDIGIEGYTRLEGNEITIIFGSDQQLKELIYSADLPKAIEKADAALAKNYDLGPKSDAFYNVGQFDQQAYDDLKAYLVIAKAANSDPNADKAAIAELLKAKLEAFEKTNVTESNKVTLKYVNAGGEPIDISGGNTPTEYVKYAPTDFVIAYTPESNNYYQPVVSPIDVHFEDNPKNQLISFEETPLFVLVKSAEAKYAAATSGPGSDGYQPGEYESGAKDVLQSAIDAARSLLANANASPGDISAEQGALQNAINTFDTKVIIEDNRIIVNRVSGETGEALGSEIVYGPAGFATTVNLDVVSNYKPYVAPDNDASNDSAEIFSGLDVTFTDAVQTFNVMYREDDADPLSSSVKTNWRVTAETNIIQYAQDDRIPWKGNSRYDVADVTDGTSLSATKEYTDFLNILGTALKTPDKKYATEEFVDEYVKDIEDPEDGTVIEIYDDLILMLQRYYDEIADSFYSTDSTEGGSNKKLDQGKEIYYEDDINTSLVFRVLDETISDPEFKFNLFGNKYLNYTYPQIKLFKLEEGQDPAEDPSVLNKGSIMSSNTKITTIINQADDIYGYEISVKPESSDGTPLTYEKGDIYYAEVITRVEINYQSPFFADAVQSAETEKEKRDLAVSHVVQMYNDNQDLYNFDTGKVDDEGNAIKGRNIDAFDLQFALDIIRDTSESEHKRIIEGLRITSRPSWKENGVDQSGAEVDSVLDFTVKPRPPLRESI